MMLNAILKDVLGPEVLGNRIQHITSVSVPTHAP